MMNTAKRIVDRLLEDGDIPGGKWLSIDQAKPFIAAETLDTIPVGAKVFFQDGGENANFIAYNDFKGGVKALIASEPGGGVDWVRFKDLNAAFDHFIDHDIGTHR